MDILLVAGWLIFLTGGFALWRKMESMSLTAAQVVAARFVRSIIVVLFAATVIAIGLEVVGC